MTIDELNALPTLSEIWLPDGWYVQKWLWGGPVVNGKHFTLLHPPDIHGVISDRRPYYLTALELLPACATEVDAWIYNATQLKERLKWVELFKLKRDADTTM